MINGFSQCFGVPPFLETSIYNPRQKASCRRHCSWMARRSSEVPALRNETGGRSGANMKAFNQRSVGIYTVYLKKGHKWWWIYSTTIVSGQRHLKQRQPKMQNWPQKIKQKYTKFFIFNQDVWHVTDQDWGVGCKYEVKANPRWIVPGIFMWLNWGAIPCFWTTAQLGSASNQSPRRFQVRLTSQGTCKESVLSSCFRASWVIASLCPLASCGPMETSWKNRIIKNILYPPRGALGCQNNDTRASKSDH